MCQHQNIRQNHNVKIADKTLKIMAKFKYLGMITKQNCIHGEIKSRLNSRHACYHAV
jgi:hypothetical protein